MAERCDRFRDHLGNRRIVIYHQIRMVSLDASIRTRRGFVKTPELASA